VNLFDPDQIDSLLSEFRRSMRRLLPDLCDELEGRYRRQTAALGLAPAFFRAVGWTLKPEDFSHWKVVGWIEELNDLVYFLDALEQLRRDRHPREFAESFLAACDEQFYENSYLDELFPKRAPEPARLSARLSALCARLGRSVTQESRFLAPGQAASRTVSSKRGALGVPFDPGPDFERAELPGWVPVGLDGERVDPASGRVAPPQWLRRPEPRWPGGLTLGPTLVYGKDKTPVRVVPTQAGVAERVRCAVSAIEAAWPEGAQMLARLTNRIVPLRAGGVVSFSYRHRPGLSFINCFDRDDLDLIDDLIHENSHHQLNLLMRKFVFYRGDQNRELFYSPWRRSLRPLRGILHAAFTFTMGAILFERLAAYGVRGTRCDVRGKNRISLTPAHILRARARCLEEVESVRYSLRDLRDADRRLGWVTPAGMALVRQLDQELSRVRTRIAPFETVVLRSRYGPQLRRHRRTLARARATYGSLRRP
jgi:HEXXH motif-containing protein